MLMREINKFKLTELRLTSLMDSFTLQMARFTIKQVTRLLSKFLLPKSKTGAIAESREPTGALKRRPRISMREPRDNRALCSCKRRRRTGAIDKSTQINGAMRRLRLDLTPKLLMTSLSMRDQPRPPGKSMEPSHQFQSSLLLKSKTGVIVASRVPTGAPRRRPKISTREPRDNKVLCSLRETLRSKEPLRRRTGAIRVSTLIPGAIMRLRKD